MQPDGGARRVAVVIPDEVVVLDVAIPIDVFGSDPHYRLEVCAVSPEVPTSVPGLSCVAVAGMEALRHAHTVVVPGYASYETPPPDLVVRALRDAHGRGARMLSICTGAFALAAAGLLANRPATTHWRAAPLLQSQYPDIEVHPDRLFVDDGDVLTSAGVTSGIDLCLHVVRKDIGAAAANERARDLVAPPVREGGQAQYTRQFPTQTSSGVLAETRAWILANLDHRHSLEDLARRSNLSRRSFVRRFREETGTSTHVWITSARLNQARELLETTELSIDQIGYRVGLGNPANTRAVFKRHLGVSPGQYRRLFAVGN
ncbi:GlxA family transcriptional regulator [Nocardia abscessus]|uniref:GlxA family transcriptional regulator n=1 Tax=Nocardia abscessus TaxID=120957 RepID=UPI000315245B|nr:helix-turn-helix domain-containing protein [Nocardia abscessus]MCC3332864.1 helix-turn-helix domain-containing protein [Nocardia abscessus]